jgi:hypothetical protein
VLDHDVLALGLALDQVEQLLAVLVAVLVRVEVGGQRIDQLLRHLDLALVDPHLVVREHAVEVVGLDDLVGEAHRGHSQHAVHRSDRRQVLLVSQHEARDRDLALLLHRLDEQRVSLLGAGVGTEVVGLVEVDRVDLVEIDEVLDLDRAGLLRVELLELLAGQHDVLVGADLIALDDLLVGDFLAVLLRDALVADARPVSLAQLLEAHRLLRRRAVELHGHVQEPEADRSTPDCSRHSSQFLRLPPHPCSQTATAAILRGLGKV